MGESWGTEARAFQWGKVEVERAASLITLGSGNRQVWTPELKGVLAFLVEGLVSSAR